jgi:hypothetical protein
VNAPIQTTPPKDLAPVQATMETVMKSAKGSVSSAARYFRDEKARTRIEHGDLASIDDPVTGKSFLLNLPNKVAIPGAPKPPQMQLPQAPALTPLQAGGKPPDMKETADLGEKFIDGIKARGKRYTLPTPGKPEPMTAEVWTAHDLALPMHSSITDPSTGTTTITQMKQVTPGVKLDPKMFEIPKEFSLVAPPALPQVAAPKV